MVALLYKVVIVPAADIFLVKFFLVLVAVSSLILNENDLKDNVLGMVEKLFMKLKEELAF